YVYVCLIQGETVDHFGIVRAYDVVTERKGSFCFMYNPLFKELPGARDHAEELHLSDLSLSPLCDGVITTDVTHTVVAVARGNCTFSEKALTVQDAGGAAVLIISRTALQQPVANSSGQYNAINITVALMLQSDFHDLKSIGRNLRLQLYGYPLPRYDYSMIIMWLIAVGTVAMGGYWSGVVKHKQSLQKSQKKPQRADGSTVTDQTEDTGDTVDVTPCAGVVFVVIMCVMLLALYFFYQYLVYVIIGLFALASAMALYACLKVVMLKIPGLGRCSIPKNRLLENGLEIRRLVLAVLCIGAATWWLVERNKSYAWTLQDILGVVFCINILKTIRLKSLKTCTIILALLFFYDVFFVFITPLFLPLPMVLRLPRLSKSPVTQCLLPYSMLGFGDIVIPAYGVGLVVTFLALILMSLAQPALLYIVPCTLLPTYLIAWRRGEFLHLWSGQEVMKDVTTNDSVTSTQVSGDIVTQTNDDIATQASEDNVTVSSVQDHSDVTLHEDVTNNDRHQLLTQT
ncbi:hypothetical protein NP493_284g03053, partial [Ridgeia piscesae]